MIRSPERTQMQPFELVLDAIFPYLGHGSAHGRERVV